MANDGMLSQEEIDALLNVGKDGDDEVPESNDVSDFLSNIEEDTLGEIGNISFGSSATTLSTLLNHKVSITTPEVSISEKGDVTKHIDYSHVTIEVNYIEGFSGKNILVMKSEDAAVISDIMLGGDGTSPQEELTDIHISAIQETMNQMMGTAATSMSSVFDKRVDISPPTIKLEGGMKNEDLESISEETVFVKVSFDLKIGDLIDSNIMQLIPLPFAKQLAEKLLHPEGSEEEAAAGIAEATKEDIPETINKPKKKIKSANGKEYPASNPDSKQFLGAAATNKNAPVEKALFSELQQGELTEQENRNLDMLLDISLQVTVELGRTKRSIKDILDMSSGSIIELDKLAGEPVDVLVNEKRVARGEVVVIDENFGVRITDIISQSARLNKLNK